MEIWPRQTWRFGVDEEVHKSWESDTRDCSFPINVQQRFLLTMSTNAQAFYSQPESQAFPKANHTNTFFPFWHVCLC